MRPPQRSESSSPLWPAPVNAQPGLPSRILIRRVLRAERRIHVHRPAVERNRKPDRADRVLEQLARAHQPGDRVGAREIAAAAGVNGTVAGEVRRWAIAAGRWPYREALCGFQAHRAGGGG